MLVHYMGRWYKWLLVVTGTTITVYLYQVFDSMENSLVVIDSLGFNFWYRRIIIGVDLTWVNSRDFRVISSI